MAAAVVVVIIILVVLVVFQKWHSISLEDKIRHRTVAFNSHNPLGISFH